MTAGGWMNEGTRRGGSPVKVAAISIIAALTLAACGSGSGSEGTGDETPGIVPAPLQTIEAQAEDIIDIAPAGDWPRIATDVDAIASAWNAYLASPEGEAAPADPRDALTAALATLQESTGSKDAEGTMQASNDVSAAIVDLFDLYHPAVPADIGRLDVLGRQIVLDVNDGDLKAAARSLASYAVIWSAVREQVTEHGGSAEASHMDASVTRMRNALDAGDTEALLAEVAVNLELVDDLERVFT